MTSGTEEPGTRAAELSNPPDGGQNLHDEAQASLRYAEQTLDAMGIASVTGGALQRESISFEGRLDLALQKMEDLQAQLKSACDRIKILSGDLCDEGMAAGRGQCGVCVKCAQRNFERAEMAELKLAAANSLKLGRVLPLSEPMPPLLENCVRLTGAIREGFFDPLWQFKHTHYVDVFVKPQV